MLDKKLLIICKNKNMTYLLLLKKCIDDGFWIFAGTKMYWQFLLSQENEFRNVNNPWSSSIFHMFIFNDNMVTPGRIRNCKNKKKKHILNCRRHPLPISSCCYKCHLICPCEHAYSSHKMLIGNSKNLWLSIFWECGFFTLPWTGFPKTKMLGLKMFIFFLWEF